MTSFRQAYSELLSLTQVFLLREFSLKDKCRTDLQTYSYFKKLANHTRPLSMPVNTVHKEMAKIPSPGYQKPTIQATNPPPSPDPFPPQTQPEPHPTTPGPSQPTEPSFPGTPQPRPDPLIPDPRPPEKKDPPMTMHSSLRQFSLEPIQITEPQDFREFKLFWKEHFPNYALCETILPDTLAKKVKNAWQLESQIPPVIILSFNDQDKPLAFLKNVAQAISLYLAPARVLSAPALERDKKWEEVFKTQGLRLMIASDYGLYLLPELMKHYKEAPRQAKHYLHQTPLLLLSDPSLYLKEPQLKPLLWRAICTEFAATNRA